jgi:hypothetical protein
MKAYRKPSGEYIEVPDLTPVSPSLTQVAPRPSLDHVFSNEWDADPMNPAQCWRIKTPPERDAEKDSDLQRLLDRPDGRMLKLLIAVGIDKGLWTLADLKAKHRTF